MTRLEIYCDGGCLGNQSDSNVGGWGVYLVWGEHEKELYGGERDTFQQQDGADGRHRGPARYQEQDGSD